MSHGLQGIFAAGLLALVPACAQAAETFQPPGGCQTYLTVQMKDCRVEHHYSCEASGTDRWRIVYTSGGPVFLSRIDAEAQWVASLDLVSGGETTTVFPARDPSSVTALLETGEETFDFTQRAPDGALERVTGYDRIVERDVVIDGEPLHRTEYSVTFSRADGSEIGGYSGTEYVSERHRRFFSGFGQSRFGTDVVRYDQSAVQFIYPGEAGFGSVVPEVDCGMMMSALR